MTKEEYEKIIFDTKNEFTDFEIISKNKSAFMKIIDAALKIITFGQMKNFMTGFITTIGNKVYVPGAWEDNTLTSKAEIIRHERIHMRQAKRYGRFLFSLLYLALPLPTVFAYFRKKFEQEAYEESLKALYEYHGESVFTPRLKNFFISHFVSANYFWMWPWKKDLEKWYDAAVEKAKSRQP
ncbi:MAG: hypothetical protein FJZ60_00040 [Chlamydiae bacterium]|nr:hypothetical protein [Chlamydiota bacterium]